MASSANHYTDKAGYNGIRAQATWRFLSEQPRDPSKPRGAYFTTLPPTAKNLASRIRVSAGKLAYMFSFRGASTLLPIRGDRGAYVLYSPTDYSVPRDRQLYGDLTPQFPANGGLAVESGTDIIVRTDTGALSLRSVFAVARKVWPTAVIQNVEDDRVVGRASELAWRPIREVFIFRDRAIADRWRVGGYDATLDNTMIQVLFSVNSVTLVVDDEHDGTIEAIVTTFQQFVRQDILNVRVTQPGTQNNAN